MAKIKVNLNGAYADGKLVTFKAPCNCTQVDGLTISYPKYNGSEYVETNIDFTFKDATGNDVIGLGNLFAEDAYVSAILDTTNKFAFLQNANTNSYIENRFSEFLMVKQYISSKEISVGATGVSRINLNEESYYPVGICGFHVVNTLSSNISVQSVYLDGTNAVIEVRNNGTGKANVDITLHVLHKRISNY